MRLSISEILSNAASFSKKQQRIEYLRQNQNPALLQVIKYAYDDRIKFLLPEGAPPYTPGKTGEDHGMLYTEARKLYLFVEGGNPNLKPLRREQLFVNLLESINPEDAKLVLAVKDKKLPYKGLTKALIKEAFPGLIDG